MNATGMNSSRHFEKDIEYHAATAGEYDAVVVEPRQFANELLFAQFDAAIPPGNRMLDIGTGTGHSILRFGQRFGAVLGVDHSPEMLAVAKHKLQVAGLVHAVLVRQNIFDFIDRLVTEFDFVSIIGCLHHLPPASIADLIAKVGERLASGGQLLIADPIETDLSQQPEEVIRWNAASVAPRLAFSCNDLTEADEAPLDYGHLKSAIEGAGLELVHEERAWELFPGNLPPTAYDREKIEELHRRHGHNGNVLCTLYRKS